MKILAAAVIIFISIVFLFFVWQYFFEIYEVKFKVDYNKKEKIIKIKAVPVNGAGFDIAFRSVEAEYFVEDKTKIKILEEDKTKGIIIIELLYDEIPKILADSKYSLYKTKINLQQAL